jgi:single-strand DNA-binding protein
MGRRMRNYVQLVGNITRDVEHKLINGKDFVQFDIAIYKNPNKSDFHKVKAWEKTAQFMRELKKGDRIMIDGKLDVESWDGQDGKKNVKTVIVANSFERISKRITNPDDANFGLSSEDEF